MPPPSYQDELLEVIGHEIEADADALMDELRPEIAEVGAVEVGEDEYFAYIRENWTNTEWRMQFLDTVGPKHFWQDANKAFGLDVPKVTKELVGAVDHKPPPQPKPAQAPRLAPVLQQPGAGLGSFNPGMV